MRVLIRQSLTEEIVALCDPDADCVTRTVEYLRQNGMPADEIDRLRVWRDYRQMFREFGDAIDAVLIATPNHHHCLPAVMAMRRGIHVYVEKPMALTIAEARLMAEVAAGTGVVTQVGNQGISTGAYAALEKLMVRGELGAVRDVWCFDDRLNALLERPKPAPPPKAVDWDLWCGGSPVCEWYPAVKGVHGALHPHDFHSWINYGNGSIGNMGTHIIGPGFFGLGLETTAPSEIRLGNLRPGCKGSWNVSSAIGWTFPAHGAFGAVKLHWYDGVKPGVPYDQQHVDWIGICRKREYQNVPEAIFAAERKYGENFGQLGTLFECEKGAAFMDFHCQRLRVLPKSERVRIFRGAEPEVLRDPPDWQHVQGFFAAVRGKGPAVCNFARSLPLAEVVLQGNVVARAGEGVYRWRDGRIVGNEAANAYLSKSGYRPGWNPWEDAM